MESMNNVRERIAAVEQRTEHWQQDTRMVARRRRWGRRLWRVAVVALGLALALPHAVQAKTFACDAGDVQCLIDAIHDANANGEENTIRLKAGTYTLTAIDNGTPDDTNGLPVITSPLTIRGAGADTTVIARAASAPAFRLLAIRSPGTLTLRGLTLRGGFPSFFSEGGGIHNSGTLTLSDCTLAENNAGPGFAIFNSGTLTITKSHLTDHRSGLGNGIIFNTGTLTMTKSSITDNVSDFQTGIVNDGGTVTITDSTIAYNDAIHGTGGLLNLEGLVVIITTTFAHNRADGGATAILNYGTLTITHSSFTDNASFALSTGTIINRGWLTVTNTTLARNFPVTTFEPTGVAIANSGTLILTNSTLADNTNSFRLGSAALLSASGATTLLQNTLLARNVAVGESGSDCVGVVISLGHNLIGDPTGCTITLHPSDLTGDPGLGDLTDNGRPGNGHIPLLKTSPARDAGNKAECPRTDQLGRLRLGPCDIGAIEFRHRDNRQHDEEDEHHDKDLAAAARTSQ